MAYLGKTPSQAVRSRYFYTAAGGETSLSGADDNNDTLIFADGNYVDVYLNGVLLVAGSDYNVNTVNTISGLTALVASDVVEIVVYDTFAVFGGTFQGTLTANSFSGDLLGAVDFLAKNKTGVSIPAGTPVYIAGNTGNDIEIAIADADDPAKMPAFGITSASIANNTEGKIITYGRINNFDTSAFALGDELYVSTTGTLTATRPTGSTSLVQKVAKVVRNQQNNGILFVTGAGRSNDTPNAITANSINLGSTTTVSGVLDEDTMTSDSATSLATQQSIKAYVDSQIGANNELSEVLSNGNTTGGTDISFGDNDKAIFGAGSDLQIYHDGSDSIIADVGTGHLRLLAEDFRLQDASASETYITAAKDGAVALRYNDSPKLATTSTGVDVTGSSGATLKLTSTDTSGADTELLGQIDFVSSDASGGSSGTQARIKGVYEDNGDSSGIAFLTGGSTGSGTPTINEVMRIRHEGNVGIGQPNPAYTLTVEGDEDTWISRIYNTGSDANAAGLLVRSDATAAHDALVFGAYADSGYKFVVRSSGNVGIGTSSPETTLHIQSSTASLCVSDNAFPNDRFLAIDVGITGSEDVQYITVDQADSLAFGEKTNNHDRAIVNEHMRLDASGNLLVGKTTSSGSTQGAQLQAAGNVFATASNDYPLYLNRLGSDGQLAQFRKDGTTVGSIGTDSGDLTIDGGASHSGLRFITSYIQPRLNGSTSNGGIDLGHSAARFQDLFLSGGVYLGGTGSANKLDDYEEGTWTPSFVSLGTQPTINYSVQNGNYTKIGRLVTVNFGINTSSVSGGSGELRINGLPFSVASGHVAGSRAGNMQNWATSIDASIGGFVSGTQIILAKKNNVRITVSDLRTSNDSNQLWWTLTYPTDA